MRMNDAVFGICWIGMVCLVIGLYSMEVLVLMLVGQEGWDSSPRRVGPSGWYVGLEALLQSSNGPNVQYLSLGSLEVLLRSRSIQIPPRTKDPRRHRDRYYPSYSLHSHEGSGLHRHCHCRCPARYCLYLDHGRARVCLGVVVGGLDRGSYRSVKMIDD